jgi:transposase InsO family protein
LETLKDRYPLDLLCQALELSQSGYHAWKKRPPSARAQQDRQLSTEIALIHQRSRRTYGSPRVRQQLRRQGRHVGRRRVARLMRQSHLVGRCRKRRKPKTTDSRHGGPIARNLLRDQPLVTRIDQVWVADITYLRTEEGWLYLAALLDRYSRRIVGWACADHLDASLCTKALHRALQHRRPPAGLIHHSDRGVQYASLEYRQALELAGLTRSMSRQGNCYDNAFIESFWSTLKADCTDRLSFATRAQAELALFDYIETFYNPIRLHSSLGYCSPRDFEQCSPRTNNPPPPAPPAKSACLN